MQGGKLRAFAVTAAKRLPSAPDIPSVDEAGLPGFYISIWHGLWVPQGHAEGGDREAHRGGAGRARRSGGAASASPSLAWKSRRASSRRRKRLRAHQNAEIEKWWPIIKAANIKAE